MLEQRYQVANDEKCHRRFHAVIIKAAPMMRSAASIRRTFIS
jgi:hypothetical protein